MPRYVQTRPTELSEKLLTAIRADNLQAFERLLDTEGLPSTSTSADFKLLKKALIYGRPKMAQALLDRGCRAYKSFYKGNSPLHLAASKLNCGKIVRRLLDHGARVDQKNRQNETPLHVAFLKAEGKVVDVMLERHLRNSFANESNGIGFTFLHIAATRPHLDNVRCLVEIGKALVNCQIDKKADSPLAGFTPLHMAVEFDRPKVAELLLSYGADLWARDAEGSTPLLLALERRNVEMVDLLLAYDFKRENYVNNFGLSHFMAACLGSDAKVADDYLTNPVNSKTALVNERVDKYTELTYPFKNYTPLHFAAEYGRHETVELLLVNGARSHARNDSGLMPEHLAAINGYHQAADLFVIHCLRHEWSPMITDAVRMAEAQMEEEEMEVDESSSDDDSGFFEGSSRGSSVNGSIIAHDGSEDDSLSYCSGVDDFVDFWEDDIANYFL